MTHGITPLLFAIGFIGVVWLGIMLATGALLYAEGERNHNV